MRPDFGHVENIPFVVFGLLRLHHLHVDVPFGVIALLDCIEKIVDKVIRVLSSELRGGFLIEILDSQLGLDMHLDVFKGSVLQPNILAVNDNEYC